ncbi:hypothetical protein RB595_010183 [Gaeumannomyces hyphopodioides]
MTINEEAKVLERYEAERSKRSGVANFKQRASTRTESLADLSRDPWVDYDALARQPAALKDGDDTQVVILGAGHAGLIFAAEIIRAGFSPDRLVVMDEAGGVGGTWYWNRYPGLTCDVEGYTYLPLLEDTGFVPKHRYARGEEIRQNAVRIVQKFGIRTMLCTTLIAADWDEGLRRWVLRFRRDLGPSHADLNGEFTVHAQYFIPQPGPLHVPSAPALPGLDEFRSNRKMFHTARWNYAYTGGTQENPELVNLKDKVIGIIGTGATAVQVAPELARYAKHLYVFQRTPSYVGPRDQTKTMPELWAEVTAPGPGWQKARMTNLNRFLADDPTATEADNLLKDGWSHARGFAGLVGSPRAHDADLSTPEAVAANVEAMVRRGLPEDGRLRAHVSEVVQDPATAEKLKAWYAGWCKRPTFHQWYLQCFNQPNVTLVDTDGQGVEAYTAKGVVACGKEYELDALVLATGFEQVQGRSLESVGAPIRGRGGKTVLQALAEGGVYAGTAAAGFPNMFLASSAGGSASANMTSTYTMSARLAAHVLRTAEKTVADREPGADLARLVIEVEDEVLQTWNDLLRPKKAWFAGFGACPPTYFTLYKDLKNDPADRRSGSGLWPFGPVDFEKKLDNYISEGSLKGFNTSI